MRLTRIPWGQFEGAFCARVEKLEHDPAEHATRVVDDVLLSVPFVWLDLEDVACDSARLFCEVLRRGRSWSSTVILRELGSLDLPLYPRHLVLDASPALRREHASLGSFTAILAEYHPRPRRDTVQELIVQHPHRSCLRPDFFEVLAATLGPEAMLTCYVGPEDMLAAEAALGNAVGPWMLRERRPA